MSKSAKIERSQKLFLKAMKKKFSENPESLTTVSDASIEVKDHVSLLPYRRGAP
jgi:hypothetical protein